MSWQLLYQWTSLALTLLATTVQPTYANVSDTCSTLRAVYPGWTLYPNQTSYNAINEGN